MKVIVRKSSSFLYGKGSLEMRGLIFGVCNQKLIITTVGVKFEINKQC